MGSDNERGWGTMTTEAENLAKPVSHPMITGRSLVSRCCLKVLTDVARMGGGPFTTCV
jgi:hypothetical protein